MAGFETVAGAAIEYHDLVLGNLADAAHGRDDLGIDRRRRRVGNELHVFVFGLGQQSVALHDLFA